MVIFTLSFYEASDLESTPFVARGVWACHFIGFGTGLAWLWFTSQREEWYAKNLDSMTLLIISVQNILVIIICLFYNTLGTSYGTGYVSPPSIRHLDVQLDELPLRTRCISDLTRI
jgi:fatty acid desaturase